jgi:hypothetical protein
VNAIFAEEDAQGDSVHQNNADLAKLPTWKASPNANLLFQMPKGLM